MPQLNEFSWLFSSVKLFVFLILMIMIFSYSHNLICRKNLLFSKYFFSSLI